MDFQVTDLGTRLDEASGAFVDTAAAMMDLDVVITSDTAVAHLAGALGRPVWVALALAPEWRWLLGREDSPWYPTMRLFRQTRFGDWHEVFERMARVLGQHMAASAIAREDAGGPGHAVGQVPHPGAPRPGRPLPAP
jgi:hypothetical protein